MRKRKLGSDLRHGLRLNTKPPQRFRDRKNDYKRRAKHPAKEGGE